MKITDVKNVVPDQIHESYEEEDVELPLGMNPVEFTDAYRKRLKDYKKRRPELYDKIVSGA